MRMSSNNVRHITITEGFLVYKFHPQYLRLSFQTLGYFTKQKVKINPLIFCYFDSEVLRAFYCGSG